jgi:threonine synthase
MFKLICNNCRKELPLDFRGFLCPCGGLLGIEMEKVFQPDRIIGQDLSLFRYGNFLPLTGEERVSLGEGMTPLIPYHADGKEEVLLKLESLSPTGSFKDRGAAVLITRAKELGIGQVVEDSSGNAGSAIAAYSARAGISARIFVPEGTSEGKLSLIKKFGAELTITPGGRDEAAKAALIEAKKTYYASHYYNPYFFQGTKTFAYELWEQLNPLPAAVIIPLGNGTLYLGAYIGFSELLSAGLIERMPELFSVQSAVCAPLYKKLKGEIPESNDSRRLAQGIMIENPVRLPEIVEALNRSGGEVVVVSNYEIEKAQRELFSKGIAAEPTAAVPLAGYFLLNKMGLLPRGRIVIPITGSGLKGGGYA